MTTPVLLITFNRPTHTRRVLEAILAAHPQDLYVFQDGAREGNDADITKCAEVRQVVEDMVTNHNNALPFREGAGVGLHRNYSPVNLGCGPGPMTGITWFFDNVEQGIIIEDDCLPHPDFFPYCEELLNLYKGTEVKFINSTLYDDRWTKALNQQSTISNQQSGQKPSYGFSHYMVTGAWASWREVWQGFDLDLKDMNVLKFAGHVYRLTHNMAEAEWWAYQVAAIKADCRKKSYWDYQMQIHLFRQKAMTIHPMKNLISNIGFDAEGTHTKENDGRGEKAVNSILPLVHPDTVSVDLVRDERCWAKKQSKGLIVDILFEIYHLFVWKKKSIK